jgi:hypothetical protein
MGETGPKFPAFPIHGVGTYDANMMVAGWDRALVASWLPERLELMSSGITGADTHPVVFAFGHQEAVHANLAPPLQMSYREFIVVVPFVRFKGASYDYDGPYAFMPRLYLDEVVPTMLGWLYGYDKQLARVRGDDFYRVHTATLDRPIIQGRFREDTSPERPILELPGFEAIRAIFEQPLVGQWAIGPYVSSFLRFGLADALGRAASGDVDVRQEFLGGLEVGRTAYDPLREGALGGFRMRVPWTLTAPAWPSQVEP